MDALVSAADTWADTPRRNASFSVHHGHIRPWCLVKPVDLLGWASSFILLLTLIRQVRTQWRTRAVAGVSKWLFVGQITASIGYTLYSFLLHNWIYVSSNIAILVTAVIGECIYLRNRRPVRRSVARPALHGEA